MKIEDEDAYPIYRIDVRWAVPEYAPDWKEIPDHWSFKGLPEGLQWNTSGTTNMFKEDLTTEQAQEELEKWVAHFVSEKSITKDKYFSSEISFQKYEVWCESWFSHWAFDIGQNDQEVLQSFSRYVNRCLQYNRENGKQAYFSDGSAYWDEPICLMGAEDHWRWSGKDDHDNKVNAPCRCKHCKSLGIIRIDH